MSHRHPLLIVLAVLALALLAPATAKARTFYGKVGPGSTITLKRANGMVVHRMRHGIYPPKLLDKVLSITGKG